MQLNKEVKNYEFELDFRLVDTATIISDTAAKNLASILLSPMLATAYLVLGLRKSNCLI